MDRFSRLLGRAEQPLWHMNQNAAWAAGEMVPMLYDWTSAQPPSKRFPVSACSSRTAECMAPPLRRLGEMGADAGWPEGQQPGEFHFARLCAVATSADGRAVLAGSAAADRRIGSRDGGEPDSGARGDYAARSRGRIGRFVRARRSRSRTYLLSRYKELREVRLLLEPPPRRRRRSSLPPT